MKKYYFSHVYNMVYFTRVLHNKTQSIMYTCNVCKSKYNIHTIYYNPSLFVKQSKPSILIIIQGLYIK